MGHLLFEKRPWIRPEASVDGMPVGMLSHEEGALLRCLAKEYYSGRGEIIDAGAFLGASSYCLAKGLEENAKISSKAGLIHAYDLFEVWREQETTWTFMAHELKRIYDLDVADSQSTLPVYMANLGKLGSLIKVYVGDITQNTWCGRPIEILFIDICKNISIWRHVLKIFYRSLIPGVSLVIHQDYHHPLLPFIHVAQERLSSYFDIVEEKVSDSAIFFLKDRIPENVLAEVVAYDFTPREELSLMDRAINRLPANNHHLSVAKAQLLRQQGNIASSRDLIEKMKTIASSSGADPKLGVYITFVENNLFKDEAAQAKAPREFDEEAYLRANPDVQRALDVGIFSTGFQHWFQYGKSEGRSLG